MLIFENMFQDAFKLINFTAILRERWARLMQDPGIQCASQEARLTSFTQKSLNKALIEFLKSEFVIVKMV